MYYQNMENLKNNQFNEREIRLLDEWLACIPLRNRNNLNPLSFSLDMDVNETRAVELFVKLTEENISILDVNYNVLSRDKLFFIDSYKKYNDIPKIIYDFNLNTDIDVDDSMVEIVFSLVAFPKYKPDNIECPSKKGKSEKFMLSGAKKTPSIYQLLSRSGDN
ncbi:hypothetical protein BFR35_09875 [Brochothrix thermosphacta]|nr:hypothetical protein BFR35_09875 [Brochothrix thermosphacta]